MSHDNGLLCFPSAVQHERGPRNSTIRRQVAMYLKETSELSAMAVAPHPFRPPFFGGMVANMDQLTDGVTISAMAGLDHVPPAMAAVAAVAAANGVIIQPTPKVSLCVTAANVSYLKPLYQKSNNYKVHTHK